MTFAAGAVGGLSTAAVAVASAGPSMCSLKASFVFVPTFAYGVANALSLTPTANKPMSICSLTMTAWLKSPWLSVEVELLSLFVGSMLWDTLQTSFMAHP